MATVKDAPGAERGISFTTHGVVIMTITEDGRLVRGPAFTTEDQASAVWFQILAEALPCRLQELTMATIQLKGFVDGWMKRALEAEAELVRIKPRLN